MTEQLKKLLNDLDQVLFDAGEEIRTGTLHSPSAAKHRAGVIRDRLVKLREGALHEMLLKVNNDEVVLVSP